MQEYVSAVKILLKVAEGRSLDQAIGTHDSPLSRQIAYGVLRNYYSLSACLEQLVSKPLASKHQDVELLILAGIYSIDALNRPAHASVNFAVEATIGLKKSWAKKLTNGVLRNYQRRKPALELEMSTDREAITNHPTWLVDRIDEAYPDHSTQIMQANQVEPPMTLRVNLLQISRENYLETLEQAGIEATAGLLAATSIYLKTPRSVDKLPGFADGLASVQDEASQMIPKFLNTETGHRVLDACAAPGGKTCAILEQQKGIHLTALDIGAKRTAVIEENLKRLKLECEVVTQDLLQHQPDELYDRILLDVPCSATGIIRRHPDIKLLRLDTDIDKLSTTQEELLAKAWSLLCINGELLYSTCSILPDENQAIVARFLKSQPDARLLPVNCSTGIASPEGLQLLPTTGGSDGFFFSRLQKYKP
tara:strand:+ start:26375 stop:27640 length:1266 start_codon:yes stop_codon:yes gene_type:complete